MGKGRAHLPFSICKSGIASISSALKSFVVAGSQLRKSSHGGDSEAGSAAPEVGSVQAAYESIPCHPSKPARPRAAGWEPASAGWETRELLGMPCCLLPGRLEVVGALAGARVVGVCRDDHCCSVGIRPLYEAGRLFKLTVT